jgi:hypothetical protein
MTDNPDSEPEEAFPYLTPSAELRERYADIFALTNTIALRLDKLIFDKVVSLAVLSLAAPILGLMWCAYQIEGPRTLAVHHYQIDLAQGNVARKLLRGGILGFGHIRTGTSEMGDPRFEYEHVHEYLTRRPMGIVALDTWVLWKSLQVVAEGKGL